VKVINAYISPIVRKFAKIFLAHVFRAKNIYKK
jgi:hypothetical protein